MTQHFDTVINRAASRSSRWGGKDVLALTVGDTDFQLAEPIRQALQSRLDHGVVGYDTIPDSLFELFMARVERRYGWTLQREWLQVLPNVVQGLNFCCRGLTGSGQSVITETPIYYPFLDAPINSERERVTLSALDNGSGWTFDVAGYEALCQRPDTRLFLLCHPQNPLGRVFDRDTLAQIAAVSREQGVIVCSDEIHCDLMFDGDTHVPFASLGPDAADNSVTLMSPSKAFSVSGLGGAFAIIPNEEIREQFHASTRGLVPNLNAFSLAAMEAAYAHCEEWLDAQICYLRENRDYLVNSLVPLGIDCYSPAATYFLWLGFARTGLNDPFQSMLEAGVELTDGTKFGGEGYLRLNFASPRETLEKAVQRIAGKLSG